MTIDKPALYRRLHTVLLYGIAPLMLLGVVTKIWAPLNIYKVFVLSPVERRAFPEKHYEDSTT